MQKLIINNYKQHLTRVLHDLNFLEINKLAKKILKIWKKRKKIFICGNGGSAGNACHIANDMIYGIGMGKVPGLNIESLTANSSVVTCLANDAGYETIFSKQIQAKGKKGDLLICLSGSGNSPNIIKAIKQAKKQNLDTFAILGYSGGVAKKIVDSCIHINVDDMQISEDMQLIIMHMCVRSVMSDSNP
jgi:D-sedoheptulose 7-phosphate isomerase